jgi:aminopeptidase-like protein
MRPDDGLACLAGALGIERQLQSGVLPEIEPLIRRLWPICRSLTGPGVRETLDILGKILPIDRFRFAAGSKIYDWTVPPEWRIRDAYILDEEGRRVVDFHENNLHVVGYSEPVDKELSLEDLQLVLHSLPDMPDAIPYVFSYFNRRWGFCLSQRQRDTLKPGRYRCVIDSDLDSNGYLDIGEVRLKGQKQSEILFSTYCCHPSMANNELSGPAVQTALFTLLQAVPSLRLSYRAAFTTETLGTLCYLSKTGDELRQNVVAGAVITCVGDDGPFTYVRSRSGDTLTDRVVKHVLLHGAEGRGVLLHDYSPVGSDERQYCSPGFDLPVGSFSRSRFGYPTYHTSLDTLGFVNEEGLARSLRVLLRVCQTLEMNVFPIRTNPYGEPQLGSRGLYASDRLVLGDLTEKILHIVTWADGKHDILAIADKAGCPAWSLLTALVTLIEHDLVRVVEQSTPTWPGPVPN